MFLSVLHLGYHKRCYCNFTHKLRLERAQKRLQNRSSKAQIIPDSTSATKSLRVCRSQVAATDSIERRNKHVLPVHCIICKRGTKYIKERLTQKRRREKLTNCEYTTGEVSAKQHK